MEAFLDSKFGLGIGEEGSGVFDSESGEPPVADEVLDPSVEDLNASGGRTLSDKTASGLDLAKPVTSGILWSCWRNKATAAVSEPGWLV